MAGVIACVPSTIFGVVCAEDLRGVTEAANRPAAPAQIVFVAERRVSRNRHRGPTDAID